MQSLLQSKDLMSRLKSSLDAGPANLSPSQIDQIALILRLGLGAVFIIGGWWKLSRAIDPDRAGGLVDRYLATDGYINAFFQDYLFADGLLSPWMFLTALSAFEFLAGFALILGFGVRALAVLFGVLMWSFVAALPVLTTPGANVETSTYLTPSLIVQIRDIGLSGLFFALALMGPGRLSLDARLMNGGAPADTFTWALGGFLLRMSVAVVLLAGGAFFGLDHVKSWIGYPVVLIVLGVILMSGHGVRIAAGASVVVVVVYCAVSMSIDKTLWNNLNSIKREIAFLAAALILTRFSGGGAFQVGDFMKRPREMFLGKRIEGIVKD